MKIPGTLYVVATPIGNLEDLSVRAGRVLNEVDVIACEDTRHTRLLLQRHGIARPLVSYHEHNEQTRAPELLRRLVAGESVALVSDAGTPVLSDPGFTLVQQAIAAGVPVVAVPGPSAITAALSVAGLPTDRFLFLGFLPRKAGERRRALAEVATIPWTLVLFEAPHRMAQTLRDLHATLGDRQIVVVRELTKKFEEIIRGTVSQVTDRLQQTPWRGELTLVVAGAEAIRGPHKFAPVNLWGQGATPPGDPAAHLRALLSSGILVKEAIREVAQMHRLRRRVVYEMALQLRGKRPRGG